MVDVMDCVFLTLNFEIIRLVGDESGTVVRWRGTAGMRQC